MAPIGVYTVTASTTAVAPVGLLTVSWSTSVGRHNDWISLFKKGDPNTAVSWWIGWTNGEGEGTLTLRAPAEPGLSLHEVGEPNRRRAGQFEPGRQGCRHRRAQARWV